MKVISNASLCLLFQLALGFNIILAASRINYEKKLREQLFLHRQESELTRRPVEYQNQTVKSDVGLTITHIIEVNPKNDYIIISGWLRMSWNDNSFKWNKDNFGGINHIRVPSSLLWKPDLTIYNHADANSAADFGPSLALVYSDGTVLWVPPVTVKFTCEFSDIRSFPFDEHQCFIKIGCWTYDGYTVDVRLASNDTTEVLSHYKARHNEWDIISVDAKRNEKYYSCCEEPYPDVSYFLHLKRISPYYTVTLLLPSISVMVFILIGFWLPPMAEEKLTLSVFNMIYLAILLFHLQFVLEGSYQNTPGIVLFLSLSLIFAVLSLVLGMFTYNLSQSQHRSSHCDFLMRLLNGRLGWILCLPQPKESLESNLLTAHEAHDNMEIPEGESDKSPADDWITLATAIDRFYFLCYCLVFIIIVTYCFC